MLYTLRGSYAVSVFPCVGLVMFTNILHGSRLAEFKRGNRNPGRGWKWMNRETLETRKDIFFQSSESLQSSLIIQLGRMFLLYFCQGRPMFDSATGIHQAWDAKSYTKRCPVVSLWILWHHKLLQAGHPSSTWL
jgi:hypothetical protein